MTGKGRRISGITVILVRFVEIPQQDQVQFLVRAMNYPLIQKFEFRRAGVGIRFLGTFPEKMQGHNLKIEVARTKIPQVRISSQIQAGSKFRGFDRLNRLPPDECKPFVGCDFRNGKTVFRPHGRCQGGRRITFLVNFLNSQKIDPRTYRCNLFITAGMIVISKMLDIERPDSYGVLCPYRTGSHHHYHRPNNVSAHYRLL